MAACHMHDTYRIYVHTYVNEMHNYVCILIHTHTYIVLYQLLVQFSELKAAGGFLVQVTAYLHSGVSIVVVEGK